MGEIENRSLKNVSASQPLVCTYAARDHRLQSRLSRAKKYPRINMNIIVPMRAKFHWSRKKEFSAPSREETSGISIIRDIFSGHNALGTKFIKSDPRYIGKFHISKLCDPPNAASERLVNIGSSSSIQVGDDAFVGTATESVSTDNSDQDDCSEKDRRHMGASFTHCAKLIQYTISISRKEIRLLDRIWKSTYFTSVPESQAGGGLRFR